MYILSNYVNENAAVTHDHHHHHHHHGLFVASEGHSPRWITLLHLVGSQGLHREDTVISSLDFHINSDSCSWNRLEVVMLDGLMSMLHLCR